MIRQRVKRMEFWWLWQESSLLRVDTRQSGEEINWKNNKSTLPSEGVERAQWMKARVSGDTPLGFQCMTIWKVGGWPGDPLTGTWLKKGSGRWTDRSRSRRSWRLAGRSFMKLAWYGSVCSPSFCVSDQSKKGATRAARGRQVLPAALACYGQEVIKINGLRGLEAVRMGVICNLEAKKMSRLSSLEAAIRSWCHGLEATTMKEFTVLREGHRQATPVLIGKKRGGLTVTVRSLAVRGAVREEVVRLEPPWTNSKRTVRRSRPSIRGVHLSAGSTLESVYSDWYASGCRMDPNADIGWCKVYRGWEWWLLRRQKWLDRKPGLHNPARGRQ